MDKAGKVEEAKAEFFTALKLEPDSASTLTGLGTLFVHEKDFTNALSYFNSALRKQPYYGDAHYNLANLLAKEGERLVGERAIRSLRKASLLKPPGIMPNP